MREVADERTFGKTARRENLRAFCRDELDIANPEASLIKLVDQALTHRSYAFEKAAGAPIHNERLEFLGDAVLGLIVAEELFRRHPGLPEGKLAPLKGRLVSEDALATRSRRLGVGNLVLLGHGEEMSGGRDRDSILADCLEAVIGAVYLDRGLKEARRLVERLWEEDLAGTGQESKDAKSELQEITQELFAITPSYALVDSSGPPHERTFVMEVRLGEKAIARGAGSSKQRAEQEAARRAVEKIKGARL